MRTVTIVKNLYKFEELSDDAKTLALDNHRHINVSDDYEWYDSDYEAFKEAASMIGLDVEKMMFSGFCCQGDGASFIGSYHHKSGSVSELDKFIKLHQLPEDCIYQKMLDAAKELQAIQKRYFYSIVATTVKKNGRYSHSGEMSIEFNYDYDLCGDRNICGDEKDMLTIFRGLADYLYKMLDESYYSLISDESVREAILDFEFYEDGRASKLEDAA